jgi:hypothetical protein
MPRAQTISYAPPLLAAAPAAWFGGEFANRRDPFAAAGSATSTARAPPRVSLPPLGARSFTAIAELEVPPT